MILGVVRVVPEADRHHREGFGAHQFALVATHRLAIVVKDLDRHAKALALNLATPHRQHGVAEHKAREDVGAARDRRQAHIALDRLVHIVKTFRHQRAAGRHDGAHGVELVGVFRSAAKLGQMVDELGRGAKVRHVFCVGVVEQDVAFVHKGRAIKQQQRGPHRQPRHQPVPHHPAAGGEVKHAVARLHIGMQAMLLDVLEQGAAGAMHDALGHAGGTRRIHDVQRVIEWQLSEFDLGDSQVRLQEGAPAACMGNALQHRLGLEVGHHHHALERRQPGHNGRYLVVAVDGLAVVKIAIDGNQHFRFGLTKTIEHALLAKIGRCGGEDRANARRGEHGNDGLRHVRHVGRYTVARGNAHLTQGGGKVSNLAIQLTPCVAQLDLVFAPEHQRFAAIATTQQVLCVVQTGLGVPAGARHAVAIFEHRLAGFANHLTEGPDCAPELLRLDDRPCMKRFVVAQIQSIARVCVLAERRHLAARNAFGRGRPQRLIKVARFSHGCLLCLYLIRLIIVNFRTAFASSRGEVPIFRSNGSSTQP